MLTGDVPDAKLLPHVASAKMAQIAVSLFMLIYTYEHLFIQITSLCITRWAPISDIACRVCCSKPFSSERDGEREITVVPVHTDSKVSTTARNKVLPQRRFQAEKK